jgi:protein-S-isoprenylcysteine O-methyltransferase Ste14
MRWNDPLEVVDVGIGIVGFFAFAFLIVTIVTELTGADALGWALTLLALVLVLVVLWQARRRIAASRRPADEKEHIAHLPNKSP